jgi:TolB-like protein
MSADRQSRPLHPSSGGMSLFTELKRRNVLRVTAAYVAVSWLLIQVVETLFPVFGLSDAAIRGVVIVLAIGLVPAVVIAWAFELTADGLVRDSEVDRGSAAAKAGTKRLDRLVMVALALAVGYFAFDKFMLDPARDQAIAQAAKEEGRAEALQASQDSGQPVLAVLPFSAVTDTEDSVFFAAGVHDDLLTKLAQLPSMLVISRTSVLEYKDTQENIRDIGAALGADAILEGGVQSAGNRIRINAQLIDAKTDEHLWAETYDRELTASSIFDVQDEIAHAISEALHITLNAPTEGSLIPTSNMAAYRAYHEAVIVRDATHGGISSTEYRELLQKAMDLDPAFTRPGAFLVGSYALDAFKSDDPGLIAKVEAILEDLQAIAPNSADYLIAQTYYTYYILKDYDLALQIANQALEMVPSDAYLVTISGWIKRRQGDSTGHLESARLARQLEPGNESWTESIIQILVRMHQYDEALAEIEALEGRNYYMEFIGLTLTVREHGNLDRLAMETQALADEIGDEFHIWDIWLTRIITRDFAAAAEVLNALPDPPEGAEPPGMGLHNKQVFSILTYWLLDDADRLAELVAEGRKTVSILGTTDELLDKDTILSVALLAAVEGDTEETERLTQAWYRGGAQDLAGRGVLWDIACQNLGMAGAAEAAVKCIRQGLEQPSGIMPFLEPHLPFYDPIRDEPVFVELVEELAD